MRKLHLIALAPLALAACKGSGDTITNNGSAVVPDAVVINGVTYVREGAGATATPTPAVTPAAVPTAAPVVTPTVSAPVDPANLPPTQPSPGDGHGG
jgi:hypothetical protein